MSWGGEKTPYFLVQHPWKNWLFFSSRVGICSRLISCGLCFLPPPSIRPAAAARVSATSAALVTWTHDSEERNFWDLTLDFLGTQVEQFSMKFLIFVWEGRYMGLVLSFWDKFWAQGTVSNTVGFKMHIFVVLDAVFSYLQLASFCQWPSLKSLMFFSCSTGQGFPQLDGPSQLTARIS